MKTEQLNKIVEHGKKLNKIFNTGLDPLVLCKKLRRIETKANRLAVDYCNGDISMTQWIAYENKAIVSLRKILNWNSNKIHIFINSDPRGYALKIHDKTVKDLDLDIERDWGGYGLIAPEIN